MHKRTKDQPIRVLIVEDSRAQRELVASILSAEGFIVAGAAGDGREAIAAAARLRPDVIAMDVHLPVLDGYEAACRIMQVCPTPIVMMTSSDGSAEEYSLRSRAAGALALVRKPAGVYQPDFAGDRATLLMTLRLMADVPVVTRFSYRTLPSPPLVETAPRGGAETAPMVLAIAASTGGPSAVQTVLQGLGAAFPVPILLAQHIARGFVAPLAEWLDGTVPLAVRIARHGGHMLAGHVYLAPDDHHLLAGEYGRLGLRPTAPGDAYCPSADLLFESMAKIYGARAAGVVLTGMGDDGARGMGVLRAAGGLTLAQSAENCVVYGMPKVAFQSGAAQQSVPLISIAGVIAGLVSGGAAGL
jgi:two-component system chemotaxis response regulator CheB